MLEEVDLPVSITWLKDGRPLSSMQHHAHAASTYLGLEVRMLDKYSSGLVIPRLQAAHAGNYTCKATNAARTATHTAALAVSGKVHAHAHTPTPRPQHGSNAGHRKHHSPAAAQHKQHRTLVHCSCLSLHRTAPTAQAALLHRF